MKKLLAIALCAFILVSCKKDKKCNADAAGISGNHRVTAVTYRTSPTSPETSFYDFFFPDACDRDNIIVLNANGTYELIDAGTVCSPSSSETGTWTVVGSTINIDGEIATIASFDCDNLVMVQNDYFNVGDQIKITLTRQ